MKMSKNKSAKYHQENKERLQKSSWKCQNPSKEENEKKYYMIVNVTKISQKMKNKCLLSIEINIIEWEKNALL